VRNDGGAVSSVSRTLRALSIHVVSKFLLSKVSGGVLVRYEESSRNTKASINIATNKIKKTHRRVLQLLAAQVTKNKMAKEGLIEPLAPIKEGESGSVAARSPKQLADMSRNKDPVDSDEDDDIKDIELVPWQELPLDKVRAEMMHVATGVKVRPVDVVAPHVLSVRSRFRIAKR
jgi:hypothetical protein